MARQVLTVASSESTYNKNSYKNTDIFDKTRLCKFHAKGKCKRGQACTFAHGDREVQPQPEFYHTQLCADFLRSGGCKSGSACSYAHCPQELRRAKMHKSSKRSGSKKVADSEVSWEVRRLEMMQQEEARLRSQMVTLQAGMVHVMPRPVCMFTSNGSSVFKPGTGEGFKLVKEQKIENHRDWLHVTTGLSRQSTEEGSELPVCFSRQSTREDGDTWDDLASLPFSSDVEGELPSEVGEDEQQEIVCELQVKRTFLNVEPVKAGSRRRIRSAPAARQQEGIL